MPRLMCNRLLKESTRRSCLYNEQASRDSSHRPKRTCRNSRLRFKLNMHFSKIRYLANRKFYTNVNHQGVDLCTDLHCRLLAHASCFQGTECNARSSSPSQSSLSCYEQMGAIQIGTRSQSLKAYKKWRDNSKPSCTRTEKENLVQNAGR